MPIEVRELVIRAVVDQSDRHDPAEPAQTQDVDRDAIVQTCVDRVMRILRRERER